MHTLYCSVQACCTTLCLEAADYKLGTAKPETKIGSIGGHVHVRKLAAMDGFGTSNARHPAYMLTAGAKPHLPTCTLTSSKSWS